jgi:hypothetical protein
MSFWAQAYSKACAQTSSARLWPAQDDLQSVCSLEPPGRVQQDFRRTGGQGRQTGADHDRRHASKGAPHSCKPLKKGLFPDVASAPKAALTQAERGLRQQWAPRKPESAQEDRLALPLRLLGDQLAAPALLCTDVQSSQASVSDTQFKHAMGPIGIAAIVVVGLGLAHELGFSRSIGFDVLPQSSAIDLVRRPVGRLLNSPASAIGPGLSQRRAGNWGPVNADFPLFVGT